MGGSAEIMGSADWGGSCRDTFVAFLKHQFVAVDRIVVENRGHRLEEQLPSSKNRMSS